MTARLRSYLYLDLPRVYRRNPGIVPVWETEGLVWLWRRPRLLCWDAPVTWLFSILTGNTKWAGDVWGLDSRGRLLIVEAKRCGKGSATCDPFEDFLRCDPVARAEFGADMLHER
jgi:hypothetical protein